MNKQLQIAVFGGGCFWCTEAIFQELKGVENVVSGYAGSTSSTGSTSSRQANSGQASSPQAPTYEEVSTGKTGHAEVIRIEFDPSLISYRDLLTVFFATHDPTTPNHQGNDVGTQYRSIILYTNENQKQEAERFIEELNADPEGEPIVTEVKPLDKFYEAEDYHQEYYRNNRDKPYCQIVINPKLVKLQEKFNQLLK